MGTEKPPYFTPKVKQRLLVTLACAIALGIGGFIACAPSAEASVVEAQPAKVVTPAVELAPTEATFTVSTSVGRTEIVPQPELVHHTTITAIKNDIPVEYLANDEIVDLLLKLRADHTCVMIMGSPEGIRLTALSWSAHRTGCVVVTFVETIEEAAQLDDLQAAGLQQ